MFIGILCLVFGSFSGIATIGVPFAFARLPSHDSPPIVPIVGAYAFLSFIQLFAGTLLVKYAGSIKSLLKTGFAGDIERAFDLQRKFWMFVGIAAITSIVLYIATVIFLFVQVAGSYAVSYTRPAYFPTTAPSTFPAAPGATTP